MAPPQLKGLLRQTLKRDFALVTLLSLGAAAGYKFMVAEARKRAYADYYNCYDMKKDYQRMKAAGVFQSVKPDGSVGEGW